MKMFKALGGRPDGFTCCELEDLSSAVSQPGDWSSDHASVSAALAY